jgi:hypothetical protein
MRGLLPPPKAAKRRRMKFAWFLLDRLRHLGKGLDHNVGSIFDRLQGARQHFTCDAVALTAVEMTFRPSWARAMEYLLWILLSRMGATKRLAKLSLGPSQLQLRHWMRMGYIQDLAFSRGALRIVSDIRLNIEAAERLLREEDSLHCEGPELMRRWTGGERRSFLELLDHAREQVRGRMPERGTID